MPTHPAPKRDLRTISMAYGEGLEDPGDGLPEGLRGIPDPEGRLGGGDGFSTPIGGIRGPVS